jgi:ribosomal protein S18 acetylase RimI-like enzyme
MPQQWWAFERGILYASDLNVGSISARLAADFRELGRATAEELAAAMNMPDARGILTRFASGRRCFGAWVEGRIAAYGWVSLCAECIGEQEREIRLTPQEAYIWDCVTMPEYRGRRLYSALLSHIIVALREEGVRRVWIGTALSNRPSLRGFVNAGFRPELTLTYARLGNVHIVLEIGEHAAEPDLVAAARRAVTMDYERVWGPLVFGWSQPAPPPACAEVEA